MPKILLGLTGSVATILGPKIIRPLQEIGEVKVVMTDAAIKFYDPLTLHRETEVDVFTEQHEWSFDKSFSVAGRWGTLDVGESAHGWSRYPGEKWQKDDPVLHIELRKWADVLVVAPLTANTLAKMANGICDNLLTSVFRAWDLTKPVVVAPAMNTMMWESPFTQEHLQSLSKMMDDSYLKEAGFPIVKNFFIVDPVEKGLACGDIGKGAMAHANVVAEAVNESLKWTFPLHPKYCTGIPVGHHPGAFGFVRHHAHHTGVDLYTDLGEVVRAVEGGTVVGIQGFTGSKVGMEWWNDTDAVLVEGRSGVINYGEILPFSRLKIGSIVRRGDPIGRVTPVVKEGHERPDVPGHSRSMLHLELYPHGHDKWLPWPLGEDEHAQVDPTQLLLDSIGAPKPLPEFEGEL